TATHMMATLSAPSSPISKSLQVSRSHGDKGYRGHNYPNRFKVWAAIEPVIGHLKEDHRMGRNYLTGRDGARINAVLAAVGYNFSLLLRWFEELLRVLSLILCHAPLGRPASPNPVPQNFLHGRLFSFPPRRLR